MPPQPLTQHLKCSCNVQLAARTVFSDWQRRRQRQQRPLQRQWRRCRLPSRPTREVLPTDRSKWVEIEIEIEIEIAESHYGLARAQCRARDAGGSELLDTAAAEAARGAGGDEAILGRRHHRGEAAPASVGETVGSGAALHAITARPGIGMVVEVVAVVVAAAGGAQLPASSLTRRAVAATVINADFYMSGRKRRYGMDECELHIGMAPAPGLFPT